MYYTEAVKEYRRSEKYKTYRREYRQRKSLKFQSFVWELKRKPCVDCGIQYKPWQMDFDHLKDKHRKVSNTKEYAEETILKEIAKCELVCANCHRDRTYKRLFIKRGA